MEPAPSPPRRRGLLRKLHDEQPGCLYFLLLPFLVLYLFQIGRVTYSQVVPDLDKTIGQQRYQVWLEFQPVVDLFPVMGLLRQAQRGPVRLVITDRQTGETGQCSTSAT